MKGIIFVLCLVLLILLAPSQADTKIGGQPQFRMLNIGAGMHEFSTLSDERGNTESSFADSYFFTEDELDFEEWMTDPNQFICQKF